MKNTTIQIRVDEENKKKIEKKANQDKRSVSNYLINLPMKEINKNK